MGISATAIILETTFRWWGSQPHSTAHALRITPVWSKLCDFLLILIQKVYLSAGHLRDGVGGQSEVRALLRGNRGWRVRISDFRPEATFRVDAQWLLNVF